MARMARGAFEQRSPHSDRITPLLLKAAVILAVAAALYTVSYGVPLSGLPEAKEMERLHIIFVPTNETRIFDVTEDITLAEDIKLALEAAEGSAFFPSALAPAKSRHICLSWRRARGKSFVLRPDTAKSYTTAAL